MGENLNFGQAIEALKQGKRVARQGWNGKGMFIFLRPSDELEVGFIIEKVKSLPQSLKDFYASTVDSGANEETKQYFRNQKVKFGSYLCLFAADGSIVNGWLASQTDMLAEDWEDLDASIELIDFTEAEHVAKVCHEVNRAYCEANGDFSQKPWEEAEQWQRESAIKGVMFRWNNPEGTPETQHHAWMNDKLADGWVYGEVKDAEKKTHPCIVPYEQLPLQQRTKDFLFQAVVDSMK